jgi:ubiquinone/menaquinone biosynthesis C-methylase UbiE
MLLPQRKNISPTEIADPLKFYYLPGARAFYLKRLKTASALLPAEKLDLLLDIGCGSGIFLKELETKCRSLHAIDVHRRMHLVKNMIVKEKIEANLAEASVLALPYDSEVFDGLVSLSVLEHVRDLDTAFGEMDRVAKKKALLVLGFPVKNRLTDLILKLAYLLLPKARLEEEHVSDQRGIIRAARRQFSHIQMYHFPSFLPLRFSFYCLLRIAKS